MNNAEYGQQHLDRIRSILSSRELDAILLANYSSHTPQDGDYSLYYASNLLGRYTNCFLVLTADDCAVWVGQQDLSRAREASWIARVEPTEPGEGWGHSGEELAEIALERVQEMVGRERIRVGVNGRFLPSTLGLVLARAGLTVEDISLELEDVRLVKDEREVELLRRACQIVDTGVEAVMEGLREGITEHQLAALAEYEMRKNGADCFWWKTLMSSGPQAENWMASPTHRKIGNGDLVVMDFTPVYQGYAGDIARTFVCGEASAEQLQAFDLAERALEAAAASLKEGVTCAEVMEAAAREVRGSPYEEYYVGAGHGMGLYDDTYPIYLAPLSVTLPPSILEMEMRANMVMAIEIILTIPGMGGVRLEDNYVVTADRPERLTHAPIIAQIP